MLSLDKYKKHKEDKRIMKEFEKKNRQLENRRISLEKKRQEQIEKYAEQLSIKYEKKLRRIEKIKQRELANHIRKVTNKKPLKQKIDITPIKQKAFSEFQKRCKLSRADEYGYVTLLDTGERVKRNDKKCNGGHWRPKQKFPQLAFEPNNCRPISRRGNKQQADGLGYQREKAFVNQIGVTMFDMLHKKADSKLEKSKLRDHTYFQKMYDKYKALNEDLLTKIG